MSTKKTLTLVNFDLLSLQLMGNQISMRDKYIEECTFPLYRSNQKLLACIRSSERLTKELFELVKDNKKLLEQYMELIYTH